MLQTFFSVSCQTGQPIMATISSTGILTTKASLNLINATEKIIRKPALLIADKEHFTNKLIKNASNNSNMDLLTPTLNTQRKKISLNH